MNNLMPQIPVSVGELLDKITILKIKQLKMNNPHQLENIQQELHLLNIVVTNLKIDQKKFYNEYLYMLYEINNALWNIENSLRDLEAKSQFDDMFIIQARKVYEFNDRRAKIKRDINIAYGSTIIEEKSYLI